MADDNDGFKKILPQVGDIVEVYGPHRGWVRTGPVVDLFGQDEKGVRTIHLENRTPVGFAVAHPDNDSAGLYIRYDNSGTPWRWPIYAAEVVLCHDCIGNMLKKPDSGGSRPTVTVRPNNVVACAHEPFVINNKS